jgi:hypothetical protein
MDKSSEPFMDEGSTYPVSGLLYSFHSLEPWCMCTNGPKPTPACNNHPKALKYELPSHKLCKSETLQQLLTFRTKASASLTHAVLVSCLVYDNMKC